MRATLGESGARLAGFTLIELMVALALTAVLVLQFFVVLKIQHRTYSNSERSLDAQEDARLIVDLVSSDLRVAGFMVPERTAVVSGDGGTAGSDRLCVSDSAAINAATLSNRAAPFSRAEVTLVLAASVTLPGGHLDIDEDGNFDFTATAGIIVSDGVRSHCARITAIDNSTGIVSFTPALNTAGWMPADNARAVPAIIYEVDASGCPVGLSRNCQLLSVEVEDLQVEFGVDDVVTDGLIDRTTSPPEFPVHDLNPGHDPSLVRSVRLTVVTKTIVDPEYTGPGYPGAANRAVGASDGSRRRVFTSTVIPRNLL